MPDGVWQITRKKRCNFYPCMGWALQRFDIVNIYGEGQNTLNLFDRARSRVQRSSNVYKQILIVYDTYDFPQDYINRTAELCEQISTEETES